MLKNKVIKNASWIIACRVVQSILGLVIGMFTARYLGPSNYGIINYAASLVSFVAPIMRLGFDAIIVNEIVNAKVSEGKILGTAIGMNLLSALMSMIGVVSFAMVANHDSRETIIVCALYSTILLAQAVEIIEYWFQAKLLSKYASVVSLIAYAITSLYKLYLLISGKSVRWFALSQALDYLIIAAVLFVIYKKIGGNRLEFSVTIGKKMFSRSRYYIVSGMMVTIFAQTDKIMLTLMLDEKSTGLYSAAAVCSGITGFVFSAIIDSARPTIFESKKIGQTSFENNISKLYCIIIYFSLCQCIFITSFASLIVRVLYGNEYVGAIGILRVIVWYSTFSYLGSVRNIWILAEEKQKYLWIINLTGAGANIILNFALIPGFGAIGAAIASLITQILTNVVVGFIISPIRHNNKLMIKALNPKLLVDSIGSVIKRR